MARASGGTMELTAREEVGREPTDSLIAPRSLHAEAGGTL